ncbi:O-methyltransferase, putative [Aspergillus udagawae]|nr:O-methyltransferase, putative [Aspergillus udagawae]GFG27816.1 O-methyltransferase, putative [Aspergillus udagawae]
MTIFDEIKHVQRLAEAEAAGDPNAHGELLAAIRKLQLAAEKPIDTTSRVNFQVMQNICVRVAIERKLLHAIAERNGEPISSAELSRVTDTDELLVVRVMRVLTAIGFAIETANQTYAANETTHFEILPGSIAAVKHHFEPDFGMGAKLIEYMRGPGVNQFADEPGQQTLFKYAHGFDKIFGMLEQNPEQKEAFDDYMASRRLTNQPQWFETYPAAESLRDVRDSPDSVLLVDVGGGPGQEMSRFRQRHPDVPGRIILQDLPLTLNRIEKIPEGIEPMEHDFFNPQPVKGARAYFFRQVLHNWSDAKSKQILSHIADAMEPEYSTLLIADYVLPDTGAELRAAEMDILMWLHTAGLERTMSQWMSLFDAVGLELVQIWNIDKGDESVLEVKRKL